MSILVIYYILCRQQQQDHKAVTGSGNADRVRKGVCWIEFCWKLLTNEALRLTLDNPSCSLESRRPLLLSMLKTGKQNIIPNNASHIHMQWLCAGYK